MTISPYLAMTAWEFQKTAPLPQSVAWMACHFSAYGTGLSNIPSQLPEDSILILNDRIPIQGHDPVRITEELQECIENLQCSGLLLDFQRPDVPQTRILVHTILGALSCPAAVSHLYAEDHSCAVFLPPCPPHRPLQAHLKKWQGWDIWLELSRDTTILTLTESGATSAMENYAGTEEEGFAEEDLHCHYRIQMHENSAEFILWRDIQDTISLLREAGESGVTRAIGFYQQFPSGWESGTQKME